MGGEPGHARQFGGVNVPLEREGDLHHRDARGRQPAQDRLVGGERLGIRRGDAVVGGEIQEHEVGLVGEHVAVEPERAEHRASAADGRVAEPEMRGRILLLEAVADHGPVGGLDRVGRIGPPRERRAEEDHVQFFPGPGPGIEVSERTGLGLRRQHRRHEEEEECGRRQQGGLACGHHRVSFCRKETGCDSAREQRRCRCREFDRKKI